jgi:hypothetical protein
MTTTATAHLLRTLAPALRGLERNLRSWLDAPRKYPLSTIGRASLEGMADDLRRKAEALDVERPLLVIMLMGGTGVGKSTLLNALAGGNIAASSFTRPTTRDPVVYYHESIRSDRLDPALRHCRLAPHDRPGLEHKVIVDTPDLDSTELANRDKLIRLLPVADVVLYVGSQEKYHDELGWSLFLQQRKRRAFAFVLNKWDRCLHAGASGLRPDEDLLKDLKGQGFQNPLLFRTCAQLWIDRARLAANAPADGPPPAVPEPPEGEQFPELVEWLEAGLTRLEIEAIKARGVSQLLEHLTAALGEGMAPDLSEAAARTRAAWTKPLTEEATATCDVLLATLEPYQREIEHHFALAGQRRFRGIMSWYLGVVNRWRYAGSSLRDHLPFVPRVRRPSASVAPPPTWDLSLFTRACSDAAASRQLDARGRALANRLLVEADVSGFPVSLLTGPVEQAAAVDWRARYAHAVSEALGQVEERWHSPTGPRRVVQGVLVLLADWLPPLALLGGLVIFLWPHVRQLWDNSAAAPGFTFFGALLPLAILLAVLVILHVLIALLLPMRWSAIRGEFQKELGQRLQEGLEGSYAPLPEGLAATLLEERRRTEQLIEQVGEVAGWLKKGEESAKIAGLYGD